MSIRPIPILDGYGAVRQAAFDQGWHPKKKGMKEEEKPLHIEASKIELKPELKPELKSE